MDSASASFMETPIFKFTITTTEGNKDLYIHSGAIAEVSEMLKGLVQSEMSEGASRHSTVPDHVDYDSFNRLCEYAYRRQYTDPEPEPVGSKEEDYSMSDTPTTHARDPNYIYEWTLRAQKDKKGKGKLQSNFQFSERKSFSHSPIDEMQMPESPAEDSYDNIRDDRGSDLNVRRTLLASKFESGKFPTEPPPKWKLRLLDPKDFDYSLVFIGHAKLYSIAKYYICEGLQNLVLHKTHSILCGFQVSSESAVNAIVNLIEHIYNDRYLDDITDDKQDRLRHLVTMFTVTKTKELGLAPRFRELFGTMYEFNQYFWKMHCKDILDVNRWN